MQGLGPRLTLPSFGTLSRSAPRPRRSRTSCSGMSTTCAIKLSCAGVLIGAQKAPRLREEHPPALGPPPHFSGSPHASPQASPASCGPPGCASVLAAAVDLDHAGVRSPASPCTPNFDQHCKCCDCFQYRLGPYCTTNTGTLPSASACLTFGRGGCALSD